MCTGLELAAIAAVAGGTQYAMEKKANNNLSDATHRILSDTNSKTAALQAVREAEQAKQNKLQDEANQLFGQTVEGFSSEKQKRQIEEETAKQTQSLQLAPEFVQAAAPVGMGNNAPAVVRDAIDKRLSESFDKADKNAAAMGALQGFDASSFLNNLALSKVAQDQATKGTLAQSMGRVAEGADRTRAIQNEIGQNLIDLKTQQNKSGGIRQAGAVASTVKNAALFAALTGGLGASGNTGAIGTEKVAAPGSFGSYGPQPANTRMFGGLF